MLYPKDGENPFFSIILSIELTRKKKTFLRPARASPARYGNKQTKEKSLLPKCKAANVPFTRLEYTDLQGTRFAKMYLCCSENRKLKMGDTGQGKRIKKTTVHG